MDIHVFHNYNKLVRRNLVVSIDCECGTTFVLRADEDAQPYFYCPNCNSNTYPGIKLYEDIRMVVNAAFN